MTEAYDTEYEKNVPYPGARQQSATANYYKALKPSIAQNLDFYVKSYDFQTMWSILKTLFKHNLGQTKHICGPQLPVNYNFETSALNNILIEFWVEKYIESLAIIGNSHISLQISVWKLFNSEKLESLTLHETFN